EVVTDIGEELDLIAEATEPQRDIRRGAAGRVAVRTAGRADDVDESLTDDENAHGPDSMRGFHRGSERSRHRAPRPSEQHGRMLLRLRNVPQRLRSEPQAVDDQHVLRRADRHQARQRRSGRAARGIRHRRTIDGDLIPVLPPRQTRIDPALRELDQDPSSVRGDVRHTRTMSSTVPLFLDCDPGIDYALALAGRSHIPVHAGHRRPRAWQEPNSTTDHDGPEYADLTHGGTGTGYARLPAPRAPLSAVSAAQAWADAAHAHPGELIGVVIGPSTNLALALTIDPQLPKLFKRLFIMGGAFNYRGNTRPTTEWNVTFDPEAAARVLSAFGGAHEAGDLDRLPVIAPIEATE